MPLSHFPKREVQRLECGTASFQTTNLRHHRYSVGKEAVFNTFLQKAAVKIGDTADVY